MVMRVEHIYNVVIIYVQVELVCRATTVLLQVHHHQLIATPSARPVLTVLRDILSARVKVIILFSFYNALNLKVKGAVQYQNKIVEF